MEKITINPNIHTDINNRIIYANKIMWNLQAADLVEEALFNREGYLADNGALCVSTGKFTGRAPKDRYIVEDEKTRESVYWGAINKPISQEVFQNLLNKVIEDLNNKTLYVRDAYACADKAYRLNVRVINTKAYHNLFIHNMFLRPDKQGLETFEPNFTIICDPDFEADPKVDGVESKNFAILNLKEKIILIGGTAYTGEMKKGIFSVLNFVLPHDEKVLSMHCSANVGKNGDTAIFFGLSGTGKTSLSTDPERALIGDDEHGWTDDKVFNIEGGCYAKVIKLSSEDEPDIFNAIKFGAIVENTRFFKGTREINYSDDTITKNTRVSYPINYINNIQQTSIGKEPTNIFFLTCDALGVLPPISKLNKAQAMFHFINGYTAKVAGTEVGVTDPQLVFSACFGEPFMPLHPAKYAEILGKKMVKSNINVWLVNTGWSGGPFGVGQRIKIKYTRAMISAALNGRLEKVGFFKDKVFGVDVPLMCENVPKEILNPRQTWGNKEKYDEKAYFLARKFLENFEKYKDFSNDEIKSGSPII